MPHTHTHAYRTHTLTHTLSHTQIVPALSYHAPSFIVTIPTASHQRSWPASHTKHWKILFVAGLASHAGAVLTVC
jgi:hypothetical protein